VGAFAPPESGSSHTLIEPSALRAAKAGDSTYGGTIPTSINAKVVSYTMNGDISVDIEPIHRTTGHKSAD
jgi:hypothetical protein